jgi:hypothetical protein
LELGYSIVAQFFSKELQMIITSVSPKEGKVGDKVTIHGSALDTGPAKSAGAGSVTFNGVKATVLKWTAEEIEVFVPTGAVTGPLSVAVGGDAAEVQFLVTPALHNEPIEEREKADEEKAAAEKKAAEEKKAVPAKPTAPPAPKV